MTVAKKMGRATCSAAVRASTSVSSESGCDSWRRRIVSTITTDPSTMMPKSIAPNESRLAGTFVKCMHMNANRRDSGIVSAMRSAPRTLPTNSRTTIVTSVRPSRSVRADRVDRGVDELRAVEVRRRL